MGEYASMTNDRDLNRYLDNMDSEEEHTQVVQTKKKWLEVVFNRPIAELLIVCHKTMKVKDRKAWKHKSVTDKQKKYLLKWGMTEKQIQSIDRGIAALLMRKVFDANLQARAWM